MRKNKQLIVDKKKGDCFRACLTSILDLPNDPKLFPCCDKRDWLTRYLNVLWQFGLSLSFEPKSCWRSGYWIASVKSKNYDGVTHAVVMQVDRVVFDPSTKKRYRTGASLLGRKVVSGGWFLEVLDASKIHRLDEFRKKL